MPPQKNLNFPVAELFVPEIKELLEARAYRGVKALLQSISTVDLAEAWSKFAPAEQALLFAMLSEREAFWASRRYWKRA